MDPAWYKDVTTSRGLSYHYVSLPAQARKPTLLFIHGFPSTSYDWRHQIPYFKDRGYGLIVPDMLGYGGTSKPLNVEDYRSSLICRDVIDVLDNEGIGRVIVIGHDWGSKIASRLANYHPERCIAYAFIALGYLPPMTDFDVSRELVITKQQLGYELYGYWMFFSEEGADGIIGDHWDSFFSLVFPHDPATWRTDVAPLGSLKSALLADKIVPLPAYITEEEKKTTTALLRPLTAPLNWYKVMTSGINAEDDKSIPQDRARLPDGSPVLLVACEKDYICLAEPQTIQTRAFGEESQVRVESFDAGHWVMLSHAEKLNGLLDGWIKGVLASGHGTED